MPRPGGRLGGVLGGMKFDCEPTVWRPHDPCHWVSAERPLAGISAIQPVSRWCTPWREPGFTVEARIHLPSVAGLAITGAGSRRPLRRGWVRPVPFPPTPPLPPPLPLPPPPPHHPHPRPP